MKLASIFFTASANYLHVLDIKIRKTNKKICTFASSIIIKNDITHEKEIHRLPTLPCHRTPHPIASCHHPSMERQARCLLRRFHNRPSHPRSQEEILGIPARLATDNPTRIWCQWPSVGRHTPPSQQTARGAWRQLRCHTHIHGNQRLQQRRTHWPMV